MVRCPWCGYENPEGAIYCIRCGNPLPQRPNLPPATPAGSNAPQPGPGHTPYTPGGKKGKLTLIGAVLAAIVVIGLVGYLFLNHHQPPGANKVNQFASAIEFDGKNQYLVTRDFNITIGKMNASVGLFNYVGLKYHAETIAVLVYLTPNTSGVIAGMTDVFTPFNPPPPGEGNWIPLIYVSQGKIVISENNFLNQPEHYFLYKPGTGQLLPPPPGTLGQRDMAVNITKPGLYWIVLEEWMNSKDTFVAGYVNGSLIDIMYAPEPNASTLFGEIYNPEGPFNGYGPYEYNYLGIGYTYKYLFTKWNWYPFNGSVVSLIVYPFPLSQGQIDQLVNGSIPGGYFALFEASSNYYHNGVWYAVNNQSIYMTAVNNPQLVQLG